MVAELISIGDEILIGQITNTNSVWIARQFNLSGIRVAHMCTVADELEAIIHAMELAASRADLVVMTGGLGPTRDDITVDALAHFFDVPLQVNQEVVHDVEQYFAMRGHEVKEIHRLQARVPAGCRVIRNSRGTAPGIWMQKNNVHFFSLPGVPYEMKPMVSDFIVPEMKGIASLPSICHRTILTIGIGETDLAQRIEQWEDQLREDRLSLAYLPQPGQVRLRISGSGHSAEVLNALIDKRVDELQALAGEYIYGFETYGEEPQSVVKIVSELLRERKKTIALAESCTGGYLSSLFAAIPGASEYFRGAIVPYTNIAKHNILEVDEEIFKKHGAVSEECVKALAENVRKKFASDYSISISGIAGPTGGSEEKPVGTVWIAVANEKGITARKYRFGDNREFNIITSANAAAELLRKIMLELDE